MHKVQFETYVIMYGCTAYYDDFFFHTMYYYNMNWPTHNNYCRTARQFQAKEVDTNDDEEDKRYKEEVQHILPDGYKLNDDNNNKIILDNPNTWPINTEKARQLRKEFVQEGYRKLYTIAAGQTFVAYREDDENNNNSVHEGDEVEAELWQATGMEETDDHDSTDTENNQSIIIPTEVSVEDWVYLAQ